MASASTLTAFDAMMKELYEGTDPQDVAMKKHVFLSDVQKKGGFVGDVMPTPIAYGHPQGRSRTFSTAQSRASASKFKKFNVTRVHDYGVVTVDSELMLASKGAGLGAFAEARKFEVDAMLAEVGDSLSRSLCRDSKGLLAKIATGGVSGQVLTLEDIGSARHFSEGMVFGAVLTPYGTPTQRSGVGTVSVVDRALGKITFTGTITSVTAGDYLFADGDYSSSDDDQSISGLAGWIPFTAPTSGDSFFGVDRSADPTRLAGQRLDNASAPIHENIMLLAEEIQAAGGTPTRAYINHRQVTNLIWEMGSKVQYAGGNDSQKLMTRGVLVPYSGGWVEVRGEPDLPRDRGYVLDMDVCELRYLGPGMPHLVDDDGNMAVRAAADDGIEVRGRYYGNFRIVAPARCGVFSLSLT